jgi:hypothetical protein
MTTQVIALVTGKETWQDRSYGLHVFLTAEGSRKEDEHLHAAAKRQGSGINALNTRSAGGIERLSTRNDSAAPDLGGWYVNNYEIPNGTMLTVFAQASAAEFGGRSRAFKQVIRLREGAPLIKLSLELSRNPRANLREAYVTGRFDVLTLEEAKARGAIINPRMEFYYADLTGDTLTRNVEAPGLSEPERVEQRSVEAADGTTHTITRARPKRTLGG